MLTTKEIQDWLIARIAELLKIEQPQIDISKAFSSYGLSSFDAVVLSGELEELIGYRLSPTITYDYPDILTLSNYLSKNTEPGASASHQLLNSHEPIAIIGMSCRFPGANDPEAFWQLLRNGVDMITEVPESRWHKKAYYDSDPTTPGKSVSYWGGFLDQVDQFDPHFFGISPMEAKHMDPQQRLLLELSYEAFDDAGETKENIGNTDTGVFVGISVNEYSQFEWSNPSEITSHSGTGNALSIAANRISYFFNLRGPSIAIDTACSSSLAAVHLACQSLRNGECNMAVSGGVNVILSPVHSIAFTKAGVLARDGRCKSFDAEADGYVPGEGGGVVILKRLSSAIKDGDTIHALILGSAMKQDGRTNGLMAPSSEGQEALLREAYKNASVSPGIVQYVEAHGTGTILGDSMEAKALGNTVGADRTNGPCHIGSVKSNIGHLEAAAGVAGLIKLILCMKHRTLVPSLHYRTPNPHIPFGELNLEVVREVISWPSERRQMVAGINSFGFGGTNVHMIVSDGESSNGEEFKNKKEHSSLNKVCLLPLSASKLESLRATAKDFLKLLEPDSGFSIDNICKAASLRRSQFDHRLAVTGSSKNELFEHLQFFLRKEPHANVHLANSKNLRRPKLTFIFSGQGGQWLGMGRELLKTEPVFYETFIKIDHLIQQEFSWSLLEELHKDLPVSQLNEISIVQPSIFAIQVALAELWKSWGVSCDAVVGHSMGEVAAAHIAGILTLQQAVKIICIRSELLKRSSGKGSMLITELPTGKASEVIKKYCGDVEIAAINSPTLTVLSGNTLALNELTETLQQQNIFCKKINVDVASHSMQMDYLRTEMLEKLGDIQFRPPAIPFYSTVTGSRAENVLFDGGYWFDNLRKPVLFSDTISQLLDNDDNVFLEIGPHPVLLGSIQQTSNTYNRQINLLASLRREESEKEAMFRTLGMLYVNGFGIKWRNVYPGDKENIPLPPIRYQRERYWLDVKKPYLTDSWLLSNELNECFHPLLGKRIDIATSTSLFIWQNVISTKTLFFLNDHCIGNEVVFPAAGYIEMALQVAIETGINTSHELNGFIFRKTLVFNKDKQKIIQSVMTGNDEDNFQLNIYSKTSLDENWELHGSASFTKNASDEPSTWNFTSTIESLMQNNSGNSVENLYNDLRSRGIHYGHSFRTIQRISSNSAEVLVQLRLPDAILSEAEFYHVHPAFLDGCFHAIAGLKTLSNDSLYLPVGCKRMKFYSKPGRESWSRVFLRSDSNDDLLRADIAVSDRNGDVVAELIDLQLQRAKPKFQIREFESHLWKYQLHWKPKDDNSTPVILQRQKHWLIFADDNGLAEAIMAKLELDGDNCHLLSYSKNSKESNSFLLKKIEECINGITAPLYGIIYLWGTMVPNIQMGCPECFLSETFINCNSLLCLVQALSKRLDKMPRIWLVTKGAQAVIAGEMISTGQSPLWGLGKTISLEIPDLTCVRIDLDPLQSKIENAQNLLRQVALDDSEDQIAFRSGDRLVQRLMPVEINTSGNLRSISLRPDCSYLITGGMGALGLETAKWMVGLGAKHLVLLGRNNPAASVTYVISQLRDKGIEVVIANADVSDPIQLRAVFDRIQSEMVPLRGIVHAAGVLDDGSLLNLNEERLREVMAPKVNGTWNLHKESLKLDLDFFVLYSSAVSVLGSPGQANYAAASSFLDAMAHYRHNMGLPAISINWGPWAEIGLAAAATERLNGQAASTQHLVKVIKIDSGFELLEQLIAEGHPQVMVLPFDLKNLIELYPAAAAMPFLSEVTSSEAITSHRHARPNLRQQYVAPRNELERKLTELWRQTLHINNVGVHDSFFELGGDSVLAAQILALAQKTFGIRINPQDAFKAFTIEKLAEILETEIVKKIEQMTEREAEGRLSGEDVI